MASKPHPCPSRHRAYILLICSCALLISIGINFTRVPIIYSFRLMTCDEYYRSHPPFTGEGDACNLPEIEASTAREVSILGATITVNGIFNLVITNWSMKTFRLKSVLVQQLVGPTIRLGFQLFGVHIGGAKGILLVQISQLLGVVGGSTGYVLVLTTFVSRMIESGKQTSAFGQLQGAIMLGTAVAYAMGGTVNNYFGIGVAFETACVIMLSAILFSVISMPNIEMELRPEDQVAISAWGKAMQPLKTLLPSSVPHSNSGFQKYQRLLLALGVLCGVLATGFIPILLQLYSTNRFGFNSEENGYLMGLTFGVRSIFLTLIFPTIISTGRRWLSRTSHSSIREIDRSVDEEGGSPGQGAGNETTPLLDPGSDSEEADTRFDSVFLTVSFAADAVLTAGTAQCREGWQLYLAAALLPIASGSAPAAKGVVVSLCEPWERADALAGIAMVEMLATILTMTLFGAIFSSLASIDRASLVFYVNGALALVAALITMGIKTSRSR